MLNIFENMQFISINYSFRNVNIIAYSSNLLIENVMILSLFSNQQCNVTSVSNHTISVFYQFFIFYLFLNAFYFLISHSVA